MRRVALLTLALAAVTAAVPRAQDAGPLQILLDQTAYYAGDSLGVTVRNLDPEPVSISTCGSRVEQRGDDGLWVPVDTLQCPHPSRQSLVGRNRMGLRLQAGVLRGLLRDHGAGWYRIVFDALGAGDRPLPQPDRTAGPFRVFDFASRHPEAIAEFDARRGWKALATARRATDGYLWGYSHGYRSAAAAVNRALEECRKQRARQLAADCWIERLEGPGAETPE